MTGRPCSVGRGSCGPILCYSLDAWILHRRERQPWGSVAFDLEWGIDSIDGYAFRVSIRLSTYRSIDSLAWIGLAWLQDRKPNRDTTTQAAANASKLTSVGFRDSLDTVLLTLRPQKQKTRVNSHPFIIYYTIHGPGQSDAAPGRRDPGRRGPPAPAVGGIQGGGDRVATAAPGYVHKPGAWITKQGALPN